MASTVRPRARDSNIVVPPGPLQKRSDVVSVVMAAIALSLTGLVSCVGWQVRPESAVIMAPTDEVWNATLEFLRDGEYKIDSQDNNSHTLEATKEIIIRMLSDRATPTTAQKIRHQVNLSVKGESDGRSVLEVIYRIDKVVVENEAFRIFQAVRDRVALSGGRSAPIPSRR